MYYMQYLKIPGERVAVLIGAGGSVKREIENKTSTQITVEDGDVSIDGDGMGEATARDVVLAIGRGFNPEVAFRLFNEEKVLEIIYFKEFIQSEKELARKKGRIIGRKGKTRKVIENLTDTNISVYGKSAGVIGRYDNVQSAKEAMLMLIQGSRHSSVYALLEKSRVQQKDFMDYETLP